MDGNAARHADDDAGLGAEVRESFVLLGVSIGITAAVTIAAQAALALLG
jgi:hypothetical protein